MALSSSLYMRKRLPHPNARMDGRAPVRPRTRVGIAEWPPSAPEAREAAAPVNAAVSRKRLREMLMGISLSLRLDCSAAVTWAGSQDPRGIRLHDVSSGLAPAVLSRSPALVSGR